MWSSIINLFYPRLCCGCSHPLQSSETAFCASCRLELPRTGYFSYPANPVMAMFRGRFNFEHAGAQYIFEKGNIIQHALHQLKYNGNTEAGEFMGNDMAVSLAQSGWLHTITHLVPVPLHARKKAVRGYNQSAVLAHALARAAKLPVFEQCIVRPVFSQTQTQRKKYARWTSVQDIFKAGNETLPSHAHVLLIDDVVTTGSTAEACARVLEKAYGARVSLAVAAYAST